MNATRSCLRHFSGKRFVPKASLRDEELPRPQRTGVQWKVKEEKWEPFRVETGKENRRGKGEQRQQHQHHRGKNRSSSYPKKNRDKDEDDDSIIRKMSLDAYMSPNLTIPLSTEDIPTDPERVHELPTAETLQDLKMESRQLHLERFVSDVMHPTVAALGRGEKRGPSGMPFIHEIHVIESLSLEKNKGVTEAWLGGGGEGEWAVFSITQNGDNNVLQEEEMEGLLRCGAEDVVLSDGVAALPLRADLSPSIRALVPRRVCPSLTQILSVKKTSKRSLNVILSTLQSAPGVQKVVKICESSTPHIPSTQFRVLLKASNFEEGKAEKFEAVLSAMKALGLPNFNTNLAEYVAGVEAWVFSSDSHENTEDNSYEDTSLLLHEDQQNHAFGAEIAIIKTLLLHACTLDPKVGNFLRTHPDPSLWTTTQLREGKGGAVGGLGHILLGCLVAAEYDIKEALIMVKELHGEAMREALIGEIWNRVVRARLQIGGQMTMSGDVAVGKGGVGYVEDDAASSPAHLVVIPTLGVHEEGAPIPFACLKIYRTVLEEMGLDVQYPLLEGEVSAEYRLLLASLKDLEWCHAEGEALQLLHPEGGDVVLAGAAPLKKLHCVSVMEAAEGGELVVSVTLPPGVQVYTVVTQMLRAINA